MHQCDVDGRLDRYLHDVVFAADAGTATLTGSELCTNTDVDNVRVYTIDASLENQTCDEIEAAALSARTSTARIGNTLTGRLAGTTGSRMAASRYGSKLPKLTFYIFPPH